MILDNQSNQSQVHQVQIEHFQSSLHSIAHLNLSLLRYQYAIVQFPLNVHK